MENQLCKVYSSRPCHSLSTGISYVDVSIAPINEEGTPLGEFRFVLNPEDPVAKLNVGDLFYMDITVRPAVGVVLKKAEPKPEPKPAPRELTRAEKLAQKLFKKELKDTTLEEKKTIAAAIKKNHQLVFWYDNSAQDEDEEDEEEAKYVNIWLYNQKKSEKLGGAVPDYTDEWLYDLLEIYGIGETCESLFEFEKSNTEAIDFYRELADTVYDQNNPNPNFPDRD